MIVGEGHLVAGWRSSNLNVIFELKDNTIDARWRLIIDLFDCSKDNSPLFKVTVNGVPWKYRLTETEL